ncbi:hypothetical protein D3C76_1668840 [compost metagenome]
MTRHQARLAAQHIQIAAGTHDAQQTAVGITLHLIGTDHIAGRRLAQLQLQA